MSKSLSICRERNSKAEFFFNFMSWPPIISIYTYEKSHDSLAKVEMTVKRWKRVEICIVDIIKIGFLKCAIHGGLGWQVAFISVNLAMFFADYYY